MKTRTLVGAHHVDSREEAEGRQTGLRASVVTGRGCLLLGTRDDAGALLEVRNSEARSLLTTFRTAAEEGPVTAQRQKPQEQRFAYDADAMQASVDL